MRPANRPPLCLILLVVLAPTAVPHRASAQEAARTGNWQRLEGAEDTRKYQEEAKAGALAEPSIAWLRDSVLPQLAAPANRSTIERVRRRIHDVFLNEKTLDAAAVEAANRIAGTEMAKLATNPDAAPIARINAMLLVGELRGKDGRPWPAALQPLAAALADAKLPPAVRVAAAAGLARHADAARGAGGGDFGRVAGPALDAVIAAAPAGEDRAGADWLVSRALDMLPGAFPQASPATAAALVKILDDESRSIDVRVRAAAALGATAATTSKLDAARAIATIRGLGMAALAADIERAERRAFDRTLVGPAGPARPGGIEQPAGDDSAAAPRLEPMVVRRAAWRLAELADAIAGTDGQGLARLLDQNAAAAARPFADACRKAAADLDAAPDFATCKRALDELRADAGTPAGAKPTADAAKPAGQPASPFDN